MQNPFKSRSDNQSGIPQDGPPSYDTAVANDRPAQGQGQGQQWQQQSRNPFVSVTDPSGNSGTVDRGHQGNQGSQGLHRTDSTASDRSHIDTYKADRLMDDDKLRELDDEMRDLPEGWVRCFDPKSRHHFYVDEATRRAIWVHPYDDPIFLANLPDDHPANPNSKEAKQARQQAEDEALAWRLHQEDLQAEGRNEDGAPLSSSDKGGGGYGGRGGGGGGGGGGSGPGRKFESEDERLAWQLHDEELRAAGRDEDGANFPSQNKGRVVEGYGDGKQDFGSGPSPFSRAPRPQRQDSNQAGFHEARSNPYESEPTPQEGRPWSSYKSGGQDSHKHRNWFQRRKDDVIGTKEEREQHKQERQKQKEQEKEALRKRQEEYLKRRQELVDKQINDGTIGGGVYNSDPYAYAPPSTPFSRTYNDPFGYGYGGGYGRRYGYGPYGGGFGGFGPYGYGGGLGYGGMGGLGYGGLGMGMGLGLGGGLLGGALLADSMIW